MEHDAESSHAAERFHYLEAREILIEFIFLAELVGSAPKE